MKMLGRESNLKSAEDVDIAETQAVEFSTADDEIDLASVKADGFYIEETIRTFTDLKVAAINENDFSLIDKFLLQGSKLYESQKQLVSNLASKNAKTEMLDLDYDVDNVKYQDNNDIKVYVHEQIGIKYPDHENYIPKDFYLVYTLREYDGLYKIIDIEPWQKDEMDSANEEANDNKGNS